MSVPFVIVEPDDTSWEGIKKVMSRMGVGNPHRRVKGVADLEGVVGEFKSKPMIIVCVGDDLTMARTIRQLDVINPIILIVIGDRKGESAREAYRIGVNSYINRPTTDRAWRRMVTHLITYWSKVAVVPP